MNPGLSITSNVIGYPKQLWLENIQVLCVGALSVIDIDNIKLTGFIGQGLKSQTLKLSTSKIAHSSTLEIQSNL